VRIVLDTNVLLSAIFTRGVCEALLDALIESDAIDLVLSQYILNEFREHAAGKFAAPAQDVKRAIAFLRGHAQIVEPAPLPKTACKDPDDIPVLGTAVAATARVLVTGDAQLLGLGHIHDTLILSPRAFFDGLS